MRLPISLAMAILPTMLLSSCGDSEILAYPVGCFDKQPKDTDTFCASGWTPLTRAAYKVNFDRQEVISWLPGVGGAPFKMTDCAIWSRENWRCMSHDGVEIKFLDGRMVLDRKEQGWDSPNTNVLYATKWVWWSLEIRSWAKFRRRHLGVLE